MVHGSYWSVGSEVVKEHTHAHSQLTCTVVFLVMTKCSLVCGYKHIRAVCYLHLHSADEGSTTPWRAADHLLEPRTPQSDTLTTTLLTYAPLTLISSFYLTINTCNDSCLVGHDNAQLRMWFPTFWRHKLPSLSSVIWSTKTTAIRYSKLQDATYPVMYSHVPQEHNPQLPTLKVSQLVTIATFQCLWAIC